MPFAEYFARVWAGRPASCSTAPPARGRRGHARRPARARARAAGAARIAPRDARRGDDRAVPRARRRAARASAARTRTTGGSASSCATASRRTGRARATRRATFGHFGRSGTFLWVDPEAGIALACLTDLAVRRLGGRRVAAARRRRPARNVRAVDLFGQELEQERVQLFRLVDADEVAGAGDDREVGVGDLLGEVLRRSRRKSALSSSPTITSVGIVSDESGAQLRPDQLGLLVRRLQLERAALLRAHLVVVLGRDPEVEVHLCRAHRGRPRRSPPPRRRSSRASPRSSPRPAVRRRSRTSARTRSGCASAVRSATMPPNELPTSSPGRCRRRRRRTRTARSAAASRPSRAGRARRRRVLALERGDLPLPETRVAERRVEEDDAFIWPILHHVLCMGVIDNWRFCPRCGGDLTSRGGPSRLRRRAGSITARTRFPGVQGILERDGRVLLARRAHEPRRGHWDLPGGFLEETEAAARRRSAASSARRPASTSSRSS